MSDPMMSERRRTIREADKAQTATIGVPQRAIDLNENDYYSILPR